MLVIIIIIIIIIMSLFVIMRIIIFFFFVSMLMTAGFYTKHANDIHFDSIVYLFLLIIDIGSSI